MKSFCLLVFLTAALVGSAQALRPTPVPNPAAAGSIQPNWAVAGDGSAMLSWVERANSGTYSLRYAVRRGSAWSEARTIVAGRRFWRHPAEVPELLSLSDGTLLAHLYRVVRERTPRGKAMPISLATTSEPKLLFRPRVERASSLTAASMAAR